MQARRFGRIINIGSEAGVATVPGLAAYCVSKHALVALTEVIQDGNHDNGIKAWVICPGFVGTAMGYVVPGANPANFLTVEEVVDMVATCCTLATTSSRRPVNRAWDAAWGCAISCATSVGPRSMRPWRWLGMCLRCC